MATVSPRTRNGAPARGALSRAPGPADESGRSESGRERVVEIQRARILAAMSELVREHGVGAVTVAHVVGRSGVSRRTFYELFEDREDCLRAAFESAVDRAAGGVLQAYKAARGAGTGNGAAGGGGVWVERVRAGLAALLEFLDAEPALGSLCVVDSLAAGPVVLERRARVVGVLVDVVHRGGLAACRGLGGRRPGRIVAEGAVGGVLSVIHARVAARGERPLVGLLSQLMAMLVLPYMGAEAAERELARVAPRGRRPVQRNGDPLRGLDMRLTYRTVRVLLAIAELGGRGSNPSGREVADASGVLDQGQISKLLARLEHLGLIANEAVGRGRGAPNAWVLTVRGGEVEQTIRAQGSG